MCTSTRAPFSLRDADEADGDAVMACLRAAFAPFEAQYDPDAWRATVLDRDLYLQRLAIMRIRVAMSPQGLVVGTLAWRVMADREGHLRGMGVVPEYQGSGLAEILLAEAEDDLRAAGCDRCTLRTARLLTRANAFYLKSGYTLTGRAFHWCGMDVREYEKRL